MPALEVWSGRGKDRVVTLSEASLTIGSDPDSADLALADPAVSRVHAILEQVGTTWLVRDLGSRNGTRLNGERLIGQRRLRDGEEILLGPLAAGLPRWLRGAVARQPTRSSLLPRT